MIIPFNATLNIKTIAQVLGDAKRTVGQLCTSPNINMWSKRKPVSYSFTSGRPSDWYKGATGNYGINAVLYSAEQMETAMDNKVLGYEYQKPSGGSSSPYRLRDFVGYKTDAKPPIKPTIIKSPLYGSGIVPVSMIIDPEGSNYSLSYPEFISSLKRSSSLSLCLRFKQRGGASQIREFTTPVNGGGSSINIDVSQLYNGVFDVYPCFKDGGRYILIPYANVQEVEKKTSLVKLEIRATINSNNHINVSYRGVTESGNSHTFRNVFIKLRFAENINTNKQFQEGESQIAVNDFSTNDGWLTTTITKHRLENKDYALKIIADGSHYATVHLLKENI